MSSLKKPRILVLDADMVSSLTISRSLQRRNCVIDVASHVSRPITGYSRHVKKLYRYPDPLAEESDFLKWLTNHTLTNQYDLVVPVTERSLVPISRARGQFGHVQVAMPAQESLEAVLDKSQTMRIAAEVGVPIPNGITVSSLPELSSHMATFKYPIVLKPVRSLGTSQEGSSQLKVSYAFNEIELRAGCEHGLRFGPMLVQELFRGQGVGIELIACRGEIAYSFQHLRLHEVPLTGGGSSLRVSVPIEPRLIEAAERLIAALKWNGVAMVEFKWSPQTEEFTLMEINGRFWGSLPLADAAGADFPSMLLDLELDGKITPSKPYKPGIYCRKLSSDVHWYEAVMRKGPESRVTDIPGGWAIFRELGLFFSPRHRFDVQSIRDPVPGLVDIGRIIVSYGHRFLALFEERHFFWQQKRAWRWGKVSEAIAAANSILYVCYGNINRSALADALSRAYVEDCGVAVMSAGFHPESGRPADPVMIELADEHVEDLHQLRSTALTENNLRDSDVIFVMEKSHYDRLKSMDADIVGKTWLLGAHGGRSGRAPEIPDPYGRSREDYERCYTRIAAAVDQIKSALFLRRGL